MQVGYHTGAGRKIVTVEEGESVSVREMLDFAVANDILKPDDIVLRFGNVEQPKIGIWFQFSPGSTPAYYWVDYLVSQLCSQGVCMDSEGFYLPEQSCAELNICR